MFPLSIIGKQFKHLYKVSIKWDIIEQENALCEMPLNVYELFISYIIKAIIEQPNWFGNVYELHVYL